MNKKQDNLHSQEAQEVKRRSEFLKHVSDFAKYMQNEYMEDNDKLSLFISANDYTLGDGTVGRAQCLLGQTWRVASGLASLMTNGEHKELFRMAQRMADDYGDLNNRRKELRHKHKVFYTLTAISVVWTCCIILFQVFGIANWITTVSNLLLMTFIGLQLWALRADLKRKLARFREDENDHQRNVIERGVGEAMQRFFDKIRQDDDDDDEE